MVKFHFLVFILTKVSFLLLIVYLTVYVLFRTCLLYLSNVFVRYYRTQKRYRWYNPSTRKHFMSANVSFFEFVSYFSTQFLITISEIIPPSLSMSLHTPASTVTSPVLPIEITDPHASKPVQNFRYIYTHRPKVPAFEPIPANSI